MSFLSTLRQWDEAVGCVERQELAEALRLLLSIQEPNSKTDFNIGCLNLLLGDLDAAEKGYDSSISRDQHMAVAFFQRGVTFFRKDRFEESLGDFRNALKELRGNQLIDYKALGLRYKLYACEVLHNMALVQARLGQWQEAQESLQSALGHGTDAKQGLLDRALQAILKQKMFPLVEVPPKVLFKPKKNHVAELEKRDYLGKAKVVASIVPQDEFSGFAPLQPEVEDTPAGPKAPEVLRALEGVPHTVLFEFVPENSGELAVVPGNVVFLLQRGADNWAYVVFNERRGLVPYNYLERLDLSLSSKQSQEGASGGSGTLELPRREPPSRPDRNPAQPQSVTNATDTEPQVAQPRADSSSCVVKVRFTYNIAVSMETGSSFTTLVGRISEKLQVPGSSLSLSLRSATGELLPIQTQTDMQTVWDRASQGHLTLWCCAEEAAVEDQTRLVALYSYESSNPEDLSFSEGDDIVLLSKINQDWLEGESNGRTGIFPASFAQEVPESSRPPTI